MSNDELMTELLEAFRSEVGDLFDALAGLVDGLSEKSGTELEKSARAAMRLAHNLKGASGSVGLDTLCRVAHCFESALTPLCNLQSPPSIEHVKLLRTAVIAMQGLAEHPVSAAAAPVESLLAQLDSFSTAGVSPARVAARRVHETSVESEHAASETASLVHPPDAGAIARAVAQHQLRISPERLEALAGHVDELHKLREQWGNHVDLLVRAARDQDTGTGVDPRTIYQVLRSAKAAHSALSRLVADVTVDVQRIRTVSLSTVVPQWRRAVRETAEILGKEVSLRVDVGDTEVDRQVLEHLKDPMVHLLRNAVDHGIEPVQERHWLGKPAAGSLTIAARMSGTSVSIDVRDDGSGLDAAEVAKTAVHRGIVAADAVEHMSQREKLALIFHDGFSTAKQLSAISGRGVGLAAVRQGLAPMGGTCSVDSPGVGKGTSFRLEVPVSVLATPGLLVQIDGAVYMLPTAHVERALRIHRDDVKLVDGSAVLETTDIDPFALVSMADGSRPRVEVDEHVTIVILNDSNGRFGLLVGDVLDQQQCVTRRLPWNLKNVRGTHGVVVLDDGSMAIAIDVRRLREKLLPRGARAFDRSESRASTGKNSRILVVDDSLTQRTLQRNILVSSGYTVDVAVDGVEALEKLRQGEYGLLLCDIEMPRMDGLELTRRLRHAPEHKSLPIVLVTSRNKPNDIEAGAAAGADEYLVKGQFDHEKLLQAVERHLYNG